MRNSKVVHFLRLLPLAGLAEFRAYLEYPLFHDHKALPRLLAALEAHCLVSNGDDEAITREKIYHQVYGKRPFKAQTLNKGLTQLLAVLREFMAWSQFRKDDIAQQRYFLRHLTALEDHRYFGSYYALAVKELAQAGLDGVDVGYAPMLLETERMQFEKQHSGRVSSPTLQTAFAHIEQGLLAQLLRGELIRCSVGAGQPPSAFMASLLSTFDAHAHMLPPRLQVYHRLCRAMSATHAHQEYQAAKSLYTQMAVYFSPFERKEVQTACLDFACRKLGDGDATFAEEVFASYASAAEAGVFFHENGIRAQYFRAFLVAGLYLHQREWAEDLCKQWRGRVAGDPDHHADRFAQALLAFYGKDFGAATRLFHAVLANSDNLHDAIHARLFLLMSQHETGETQALEYLCHSFRMFLDRNREVSAASRARCIAFLNYLRRFLNTPLTDQQRFAKLRKALQPHHMHGLAYPWLLEKVGGRSMR